MYRIKTWEELTIQDNFLFQKVMQNKRICKHLIELILQIKIKEISFPETEKTMGARYDRKSIRLDVYVEDETGRVFDIEMQCTDGHDDALAKRTRYYQGSIDMDLLEKGHMYEELKPTFIIFICTFDPFHQGLPIYTFRNRCIEQEGLELGDQTTKLFLNCKGNTDSIDPDVAAFLRYVDGNSAEGAFVKQIDNELIHVKRHDETRREYMTLAMEMERMKKIVSQEARAEGKAEGKAEGRLEGAAEMSKTIAKEMLHNGIAIELVSSYTHLPTEELKKLQDEIY